MKKLILTAAAAMMVLASCTKTTVESIDGPKEIAFKKIEGAMTKAVAENLAGNTTMGVFAFNHGTTQEYFSNALFEFNSNQGAWAGGKYWPLNGDALDFVVYAPYIPTPAASAEKNNIALSSRILTFTINESADNSSEQLDFLYGEEYYDSKDGTDDDVVDDGYNKSSNNVRVNLKHALAKITVKASANADDTYTIESLSINNVPQTGTIVVTYNDDNHATKPDLVGSVVCTPATDPVVTKTYTYNNSTPLTTTAAELGSCFAFPGNTPTTLTITYTMEGHKEGSGNQIKMYSDIRLTSDPESKWLSGYNYIYTLHLNATEILFEPSVIEWTPADQGTTNVEQGTTVETE